ncbi:hypothetical protein [Aliterella atlantica]|uniref:hypothetical protein n=1 Tax=Aliterella atlantica TaxID=1827278 RepID=UPI001186FB39|nr:hypothetical protein [Aliterella atlantica]
MAQNTTTYIMTPGGDIRVQKLPILSLLVVLVSCRPAQTAKQKDAIALNELSSYGDLLQNPRVNSTQTIANDMQPPHEGAPHGVPRHYNWAFGPRVGMGNNPGKFAAMTAWGQVYVAATGNAATNTRIQIRDIKSYVLSKRDNKWHLLQSSKQVDGNAYREDFAGDISIPANVRREQDGSISVKVDKGYNYHFWCACSKATIDGDNIKGVFTTVQARLVVDNPQKPDDRAQARYLLSMGGDYWLNLTAKWDNGKTNADIGIGKFKYVKNQWQAFNMTTLSPTAIRRHPPPIQ